jgi:hypothetical protein
LPGITQDDGRAGKKKREDKVQLQLHPGNSGTISRNSRKGEANQHKPDSLPLLKDRGGAGLLYTRFPITALWQTLSPNDISF